MSTVTRLIYKSYESYIIKDFVRIFILIFQFSHRFSMRTSQLQLILFLPLDATGTFLVTLRMITFWIQFYIGIYELHVPINWC